MPINLAASPQASLETWGGQLAYVGFFFPSDFQEHLTDIGFFSQGGHLFVEGDGGRFTEAGGWQDFLSQLLNSIENCNSI